MNTREIKKLSEGDRVWDLLDLGEDIPSVRELRVIRFSKANGLNKLIVHPKNAPENWFLIHSIDFRKLYDTIHHAKNVVICKQASILRDKIKANKLEIRKDEKKLKALNPRSIKVIKGSS